MRVYRPDETHLFDPGPCPRCSGTRHRVNWVDVHESDQEPGSVWLPGTVECLNPACEWGAQAPRWLMSPRRAPTVCSHPGCWVLTDGGACDAHRRQRKRNQAQQRRAAGDPSMDVYSTDQWRAIRRAFLRTHPTCVRCGAKATEADHIVPRQLLVALGIHDPDHEQWLQPLCKPHHSSKTKLIDQPLLRRWRQGEDAQTLAEEAMRPRRVGYTT